MKIACRRFRLFLLSHSEAAKSRLNPPLYYAGDMLWVYRRSAAKSVPPEEAVALVLACSDDYEAWVEDP